MVFFVCFGYCWFFIFPCNWDPVLSVLHFVAYFLTSSLRKHSSIISPFTYPHICNHSRLPSFSIPLLSLFSNLHSFSFSFLLPLTLAWSHVHIHFVHSPHTRTFTHFYVGSQPPFFRSLLYGLVSVYWAILTSLILLTARIQFRFVALRCFFLHFPSSTFFAPFTSPWPTLLWSSTSLSYLYSSRLSDIF